MGIQIVLRNIVRKYLETRFVMGLLNRNDRIGTLHRAWGHVFSNHIRGDYVEFGMYRGDSFVDSYRQYQIFERWLNQQMISPENWRRKVASEFIDFKPTFYGLDTFSGMPVNEEGNSTFATGTFYGDLSLVRSKCEQAFLEKDMYNLYQGLFKDTTADLLQDAKHKAAIINIDCDIYESAKDALQACSSLLQVGTVILLDDYNAFCADNRKGERRAFREFQEISEFKFDKWFAYHYSGQAFLCVGHD